MNEIRRKLLSHLGQSPWFTPATGKPAVRHQQLASDDNLAEEYQGWARWLDGLRAAAQQGDMAALRALAHGKLRFLLRRTILLRDNTMLGIRQHAHLAEASALIREFEQLMGELTGRPMPAHDEWPLPARLYDTLPQQPEPPPPVQERRRQPARQNRLDPVSKDLAQQVCNSLQLILRLLQQHSCLAGHAGMKTAANDLAHAMALGLLDTPCRHDSHEGVG